MKKILSILILSTLGLAVTSLASNVYNVELSYQDGATVADIFVEGAIRFTHETVEAKDGKPFRVLVDILSAEHQMAVKDFEQLPECVVTRIRTSQYSVKPEKIVRLVFDLKRELVYRVETEGKIIRLFMMTKDSPKFSRWSASASVPALKSDTKLATTPPVSGKTTASINKSIENDRLLSLEGEPASAKSTPKSTKPVVAKSKIVKKSPVKKPEQKKTLASVPGGNVVYGPEFTQDLQKPEKQESKIAPTLPVAKKTDAVQKPKTEIAAKENKAEVAKEKEVAVKKEPPVTVKTTKQTVAEKPTAEQKAATAALSKSQLNKEWVSSVNKEKMSVPAKAKLKSAPPKTVVKKEPAPQGKPDKVQLATKAQEPKPVAKKQTPSKPADVKVDKKTDTKTEKSTKPRTTSRFRRSPTGPTKIKGTLVAEFPKRLVIKYKARSYRDPFETLINESRTYNNPIERRVPNVEGLKLVGIIEADNGENRALFEDKDAYGYILRAGDKVQKGYVLRVENDKVFFQIFEYGWSRTIALNIDEE